MLKNGLILGALLGLTACGGGGGGGGGASSSPSGVGNVGSEVSSQFIVDVPVKGVGYESAAQGTLAIRKTGENGALICIKGESVKLYIDGKFLGAAPCSEKISILSLNKDTGGYYIGQASAILQTYAVKNGGQRELPATVNTASFPTSEASNFDASLATVASVAGKTPVTVSAAETEVAKNIAPTAKAIFNNLEASHIILNFVRVAFTGTGEEQPRYKKTFGDIIKIGELHYFRELLTVFYESSADLEGDFGCKLVSPPNMQTCYTTSSQSITALPSLEFNKVGINNFVASGSGDQFNIKSYLQIKISAAGISGQEALSGVVTTTNGQQYAGTVNYTISGQVTEKNYREFLLMTDGQLGWQTDCVADGANWAKKSIGYDYGT